MALNVRSVALTLAASKAAAWKTLRAAHAAGKVSPESVEAARLDALRTLEWARG